MTDGTQYNEWFEWGGPLYDNESNLIYTDIHGYGDGGSAHYTFDPVAPGDAMDPECRAVETEADVYDGTTVLNKTAKSYVYNTNWGDQWTSSPAGYTGGAYSAYGGFARIPILHGESTTYASGLSASKTYSYDPGFTEDNVIENDNEATNTSTETAAVILGITVNASTTGLSGENIKSISTNYEWQDNQAYYLANMLDLPSSVTVSANAGNSYTTQYTYDEPTYSSCNAPSGVCGLLTSVTDGANTPQAATTHTGYNTEGMVSLTVDGKGVKTTVNSYRCNGSFPQSITKASGSSNVAPETTTYSYDCVLGKLLSITDPNLEPTSYTYDTMGRLAGASYPDGGAATISYDNDPVPPMATVSTLLNKSTNTWKIVDYKYDGLGRLSETVVHAPEGYIYTDKTYDDRDRAITQSNPYLTKNDATYGITKFTWDALNRKTSELDSDGTSLKQWCYDNTASAAAPTNCRSHASAIKGEWVDYADEDGNDQQQTYDALGRLTSVMEPNGTSAAPSMETDYQYDVADNLLSVTQWGGPSGSSGARIRSYSYDSLSRLVTAANSETGTTCYGIWSGSNCVNGYDANGNLVAKTDAREVTTYYGYDDLNRLVSKSYSSNAPAGSLSSCYRYDTASIGIGRLGFEWTQAGNCPSPMPSTPPSYPTAQTEWVIAAYDPMGRVISKEGSELGVSTELPSSAPALHCTALPAQDGLNFCYDSGGNLLAYDNGLNVLSSSVYDSFSQTFDGAGRLSSISSSLDGKLLTANSSNGYTPFGALENWTLGSNIAVTKNYDKRMRVTGETATNIYNYTVNYDPVSSVASYTDSVNGTWSMANGSGTGCSSNPNGGYDCLNRLIAAQATAGPYQGLQAGWSYDSFGNRTAETFTGNAQVLVPTSWTASYNASNQVSGTSLMLGGPLGYDAAGNVTQDNLNAYAYDAEGRICATASTLGGEGSSVTQYTYDAEGQRVAKGSAHTVLVNGAYVLSCDTTQNGFTLKSAYIPGPSGRQLSELLLNPTSWGHTNVWVGDQLIATNSPNGSQHTLNFEFGDWLGTRRVLTDSAGNIQQKCNSLPYGNGETCSPTPTEHLFTGKERDEESGNDYFGARYYSSTMGRFLSPDKPFTDQHAKNPQSWDLYAYARNNPLTIIDSNGEAAVVVVNGNNVTIYLPVSFSGNAATPGNEAAYATAITSGWTGRFGNYNVTMHVVPGDPSGPLTNDVHINNPAQADGAFPRPKTDVGGPNMNLFGLGNNAAQNKYETWASQHETGHAMGEQDQYKDVNGQSVPNPGYGTNIMGAVNGTPDARDINNIIAFHGNTVLNITLSVPLNTETPNTTRLIPPKPLQLLKLP